jgi:hypothetical protein
MALYRRRFLTFSAIGAATATAPPVSARASASLTVLLPRAEPLPN